MRAIIIDPSRRSVIEADIDGSARSVADIIGCDRLSMVYEFETGDSLYVDEDGGLRAQEAIARGDDVERAAAFDVGAQRTFLGKGVVLGPEDGLGGNLDAVMSPARLSSIVFVEAPAAASDAHWAKPTRKD